MLRSSDGFTRGPCRGCETHVVTRWRATDGKRSAYRMMKSVLNMAECCGVAEKNGRRICHASARATSPRLYATRKTPISYTQQRKTVARPRGAGVIVLPTQRETMKPRQSEWRVVDARARCSVPTVKTRPSSPETAGCVLYPPSRSNVQTSGVGETQRCRRRARQTRQME